MSVLRRSKALNRTQRKRKAKYGIDLGYRPPSQRTGRYEHHAFMRGVNGEPAVDDGFFTYQEGEEEKVRTGVLVGGIVGLGAGLATAYYVKPEKEWLFVGSGLGGVGGTIVGAAADRYYRNRTV